MTRSRKTELEREWDRLQLIEHYLWHLLDDSEEREQEVVIPKSADWMRLCQLLPEDHPIKRRRR